MVLVSHTKVITLEPFCAYSRDSYDNFPLWRSSSVFGATSLVDSVFSCIAEFGFIVVHSFPPIMVGSGSLFWF